MTCKLASTLVEPASGLTPKFATPVMLMLAPFGGTLDVRLAQLHRGG